MIFKKIIKEITILALKFIALGVFVGTGVRVAEWVIPAPELRVVVCMTSDIGKVETCTSAATLLKNMQTN